MRKVNTAGWELGLIVNTKQELKHLVILSLHKNVVFLLFIRGSRENKQ